MIVISPARGAGVEVGGEVVLFDATWGDVFSSPASVTFANNGTVSGQQQIVSGPNGWTWLLSGEASAFQIRAQPTSGSVASGSSAVNSWLSLGTTRTWTQRRTHPADDTVVLLIRIRDAASQTVRATCTITLLDD